MKLDVAAAETLRALRRANGATFTELVEIAGLDPARDLRDTDLSDVDFAGSDLEGYDFSGSKLTNASFADAHNYQHAIFARAEIHGVTWPSGWRPKEGGRPSRALPHLNAIQQESVNVLVKALKSDPSARAVAKLPPGVGKSAILVEVFYSLSRTKAFKKGLILCETVAERNQLVHRLRDRAVVTADNDQARNTGFIPKGETLVETYGNYSRMQNELALWAKEDGNPLECTHVVLTSLPSRRRATITRMAEEKTPPAMLAFIDALAVSSNGDDRLKRSMLGRVFTSITYQYEIGQAVEDGLLVISELIDRSKGVSEFRSVRGVSDDRTLDLMEQVARDYNSEVNQASELVAALLIVPEHANVELLAEELGLQLLRSYDGPGKLPRVVALTAREPKSELSAPPHRGLVAITKPAVADGLDIREFGLVCVLTGLNERLTTKVIFTPSRRIEAGQIRVHDYVGNLIDAAVNALL